MKTKIRIMSKRITIMIDDDLDKKLRMLQAKEVTKTAKSVSFSQIINDTIRKSVK
jgi:hypothetical protein